VRRTFRNCSKDDVLTLAAKTPFGPFPEGFQHYPGISGKLCSRIMPKPHCHRLGGRRRCSKIARAITQRLGLHTSESGEYRCGTHRNKSPSCWWFTFGRNATY